MEKSFLQEWHEEMEYARETGNEALINYLNMAYDSWEEQGFIEGDEEC